MFLVIFSKYFYIIFENIIPLIKIFYTILNFNLTFNKFYNSIGGDMSVYEINIHPLTKIIPK